MTNVHGKCHHLNCQKYSEPLTFLQYNIFTSCSAVCRMNEDAIKLHCLAKNLKR